MLRSRIAKWSYQFGCVSAAVAIIYRVFWFGGLGARLFGAAPHIVPHSFGSQHSVAGDLDRHQFSDTDQSRRLQNSELG